MSDFNVTYYRKNRCKLDASSPYFDVIREEFSYEDKTARFSSNENTPKRKYSIAKNSGYCDIGLLWSIIHFIKASNYDVKVRLSDGVKHRLVTPIPYDIVNVPNTKYTLRDYQLDSIRAAFKVGNGLELVGTGGGKTLIMATMLETIYRNDPNCKVLIVVPNIGLVNQTFGDFTDYECTFSFSKWSGGNELDSSTNVTIVNTGFLQTDKKIYKTDEEGNKVKDAKGKPIVERKIPKDVTYNELFETIDILIYDEVHQFFSGKTPKASKLLQKFEYTHRFGFTGSLPKGGYEQDKIMGYFGAPIYTKSSKSLRDEEYLSNVIVKMIKFEHIDPYRIYNMCVNTDATEDYFLEVDHVIDSEFRNNAIKRIASRLDGNCLILVERIRQGEVLKEILEDCEGKRVFFISGETPVPERLEIMKDMEASDDVICIAMSRIFAVGVSINNLPYLIFAYLGKAWVKVIQAVGRGLRLHERKEKLYIFDMYDNLLYSGDHAIERKEIYDNQEIEYTEHKINEQSS
jgi:superfamily II DNA or RNA helicase